MGFEDGIISDSFLACVTISPLSARCGILVYSDTRSHIGKAGDRTNILRC